MKTTFNSFLNESKNSGIICYHRSNELEHMENADFKLDMGDDYVLFGNAIYFSESPDISHEFGRYICKFEIKLQEPVLDMNKKISVEEANELLKKFNVICKNKAEYDFSIMYNDGVQYGEFFDEINELYNWGLNTYYKEFIHSLGFKSFKYFCTFHTDFRTTRGDYGLCYGIYNPNDIKFVDGPF